jgi:threonine dehydrogenase-like Zn-dependent dehydrogenase
VDFSKVDPVAEILRLTDGRGVDVAIESLGTAMPEKTANIPADAFRVS